MDSFSHNVSGNFYPVSSAIRIEDGDLHMSVFNDRSQSGSSLKNGTISLLVQRRIGGQDGYGMSEPINEFEQPELSFNSKGIITRFTFYMEIGYETKQRQIQQIISEPISIFASFNSTMNDTKPRNQLFSFEKFKIPETVKMTLQPLD